MTIPLLELDDRTYDDLVKELQALIPRYAPGEWSDRNPSDPGTMLVEFLAWLTESQIYRINRVPKNVYLTFFKWLIGDQQEPIQAELAEQLKLKKYRRQAFELFSQPRRLISQEDFNNVILEIYGANSKTPWVERVYCVPERDLSASYPQKERSGHVSVLLVARPVSEPLKSESLTPGLNYQYRVNPCGKRLVVYGGNQILTWTAAKPTEPIQRLPLPDGAMVIYCTICTINPDEDAVAVSYNKKGISYFCIWKGDESNQFSLVGPDNNKVDKPVHSLFLAGQNGPLAIQFEDKDIQLWWFVIAPKDRNNQEAEKEQKVEKMWQKLPGTMLNGNQVYLRPDGFRMAIQTEKSLQLWQLEDNWLATTFDMEIRGQEIVVSQSPHHRFAAVINDANELALWDIWRGEKLWMDTLTGEMAGLEFSCDENRFIVRMKGGKRECWAVASGEKMTVSSGAKKHYWAESDDGKRGVTREKDKRSIKVWDIERGEEVAIFEAPDNLASSSKFFWKAGFLANSRYLHTEICSGVKDAPQRTLSIWEIGFDAVEDFVAENHQIGCRHHVMGTRYLDFWIKAEVVVSTQVNKEKLNNDILDRLAEFFDPRRGGPEKQGWPFDRDVTLSEVYQTIHGVPGVAYIPSLFLVFEADGKHQEEKTIEVKEFELVNFNRDESKLDIQYG